MSRLFVFYLLSSWVALMALHGSDKPISDGPGLFIGSLLVVGSLFAFVASVVGMLVRRITGRLSSYSVAAAGSGGLAALAQLLIGYVPAVMVLAYFVAIECLWWIPFLRR